MKPSPCMIQTGECKATQNIAFQEYWEIMREWRNLLPLVPPCECWFNGHWLWGLYSVKGSTCRYSNYFKTFFPLFLKQQCRNWAGKAVHQTASMDISTGQLGGPWEVFWWLREETGGSGGLTADSQLENSAPELGDWVIFQSLRIFWYASLLILFANFH